MAMTEIALIHAPLIGKDFLRSSHIPFWGRDSDAPEQAYQTTFQRDFKSFASLPKRNSVPRLAPAEVEHRDIQRIKEYQTEAVKSYSHHPQLTLSRTPAWTKLCTNFKMHSDHRHVNFLTTQAEGFQHLSSSLTGPTPIRPVMAIKKNQQEEKLPETTHKSSFMAYSVLPVVKAKVKHLGGAPTIKGDRDELFFSSHHNEAFQGKWCTPPQPVEKHFHSSIAMGDPEKILETETTHAASFRHPGAQRPATIKERLKVNLGDFNENRWPSTTSDAYNEVKSDPVLLLHRNKTFSSVPRGDTDPARNQERMMATTNRIFFSEVNHREVPVHVDGASLRTKSHVELGRPSMGGIFYSTSSQEAYPQRDVVRVRPHSHPSGHVLSGQEPGPALTTMKKDYLPLNCRRQELSPRQLQQIKASHITAPYSQQHFSTTHEEAFGPKPLSKTSLDNPPRQHVSHMPF